MYIWTPLNSGVATAASCITLARMDDDIPVIIRMHVECAMCAHQDDETYEFDMPRANSEPMEEYVSGTCPDCDAAIHMHLERTQQRQ